MPRAPSADPAEQHPGAAVPREPCDLVDDQAGQQPVDLLVDREDRQATPRADERLQHTGALGLDAGGFQVLR